MKIIIIGGGWYGCYCALLLQKKHNVILLEKEKDLFTGASYYNQNRLHLGYHYPRNYKTRQMCLDGYHMFFNKFSELVDDIDNNYYCVSNDSLIDYETYKHIFINYEGKYHAIKNDDYIKNIQGFVFDVKEKVINSEKSKNYFKNNLKYTEIQYNYEVKNIEHNLDKITINNQLTCDLCLNCTYNQLSFSNAEYIYEKTISLVYERINKIFDYGALTIMDGNFSSIYPHNIEKKEYTLTNVKHTPLIKSKNIKDILDFKLTDKILNKKIELINEEIVEYLPQFNNEFKFKSYFLSFKTKIISNSDSRECIIENKNGVISVNCGKIIGIFEVEKYLGEELKLI